MALYICTTQKSGQQREEDKQVLELQQNFEDLVLQYEELKNQQRKLMKVTDELFQAMGLDITIDKLLRGEYW